VVPDQVGGNVRRYPGTIRRNRNGHCCRPRSRRQMTKVDFIHKPHDGSPSTVQLRNELRGSN
jgi:hypothetical protein